MSQRPVRSGTALVLVTALAAAIPASAANVRLPSRFVPGDAAVSPATNDQSAPHLSQGAGTVLAVWSDSRANSTGGYEGETSRDIYGMRFDASGTPLDALPFVVTAGRASQERPRAAWNGTHWLVVYESYDLSGTGYYYQKSLEAVRVAPDGSVVDPMPIRIYNVTPTGGTWAVASDGVGWAIAIQGTSSTGDVVALRVSADGILLDHGGRNLVPETYYLRGGFHLAWAGGVYLLAYEESMTGSDPTSAIRFDAALNPLDPEPFALVGRPLSRLISNGSVFYAVWTEQLPDYTVAVKGTRIDTDGRKLDGDGDNLSGPNQPGSYTTTSVVWDGTYWKATWDSGGILRIARVSTNGQVLDPGGVAVPGPQSGPTASAGNGTVQVIWSALVTSDNDVHAAHISSGNAAGPNRAVGIGTPAQSQPDVASGSGGYMMVYRSVTSTTARILAQPLDAAGNPTLAEPVVLEAGTPSGLPGGPAVAWNGTVFMASWPNESGVVARRLQADGTLVDPAPFVVLNPGFGSVDVEGMGGNFLVIGLRCGINCQYIFPIAARVRGSDGLVLDPSPLQMSGTFCSGPRLAVLGGRWLAVWRANVTHDDPMASTLATFIDAGGAKVPDFTVHAYYSTAGGNGIFTIGLASSGSVALMVQSQELSSGVETDLLSRRIEPDGTVHPYVNLTPWIGNQYRPRAAWDGSRFVVVFQDQKARLSEHSLEQLDARSDLIGMRITPEGGVVDPQGFVFSNSPFGEAWPNVATLGGTTLIAGSIVRNDAANVNYRIGYDLLGSSGNAWPVAVAVASPAGGDVPLSVAFSSSGSGDPDGAVASTLWEFGDGASSSEADPAHLYTIGGPYVATLTVTDNAGAQTMQELLVRAVEPNILPVAVASSNTTSGPAPLDVTFYARGSYDPDGFLGNFKWTFEDGGEYWGATAYHTFYQQGTWQVSLTVYDSRGGTGTDELTITAGDPLPPAAPSDLTAIAFTTEWINLTWTDNSNNEEGFKVERCQGTALFCNANPSNFAQIAQTGPNIDYYGDTGLPSGTTFSYRVRSFNVTAHSGWSNTATATTQSAPPVADAVASVLNGLAPLAVVFDGSGSTDPDGTIVSWSWDFGDGGTGTGAVVSHTYGSSGTRTATLTVTDDDGATDTDFATIVVKAGNQRRTATADWSTAYGSVFSGSYLDTQTQNDVAEVLVEARTSGSPSTRQSLLEHTWTLTVASGIHQSFHLDAWHTPNAEGDDFLFEYSRDNASWTPMLTVTKTVDDDVMQSYAFSQDVTGTLYVRVRDLDRTPGRGQTDRVSIDEMFVQSSPSSRVAGEVAASPLDLPGSALLVSKAGGGDLLLDWGASCVATDNDYAIYEGTIGAFTSHLPAICSTAGATSATISPSSGDTYYLVVPGDGYHEGRYGRSSAGEDIPAGPTRCYPAATTMGCP